MNLEQLTGLSPFVIDTMQFAAILIGAAIFYFWGHTAGRKELQDRLLPTIRDLKAKISEKVAAVTPQPDWRLDAETGNYLSPDGIMHVVPRTDAELIAMIRATLGLADNQDTLAELKARLDFHRIEKQTLERGMETMRGGIGKAAELLTPMLAELQTLRAALRQLADAADRVGVRFFDTDTPLEPEVEAMQDATKAARAALTPKDDPSALPAELADLGVVKGHGSIGGGGSNSSASAQATPANQSHGIQAPSCPKCGAIDGGDWSQCHAMEGEPGRQPTLLARCPIGFSPHFDQATADHYAGQLFKAPANDPSTPSA